MENYKELILDLVNRITKLEKEVELLKSANDFAKSSVQEKVLPGVKSQQRDKTRYMFAGNVYLKNKLVFAIVEDYVAAHPSITCEELKNAFPKSLQGSIGVVEYESVARKRKDCEVRFFGQPNEILRLKDGTMLICSQWGVLNIPNFIKRATQLGYTIEKI